MTCRRRSVLGGCVVAVLSTFGCLDNPYVIGTLPADGGEHDAAVFDPCAAHPDALACSGFEPGVPGDWSEPVVEMSASVAQSTARARSGRASLYARSDGPQSTAVLAQAIDPRFDGALFLRTWLFVPGGFATQTMNLLFLGDDPNETTDPAAPFLGMDLNLEDGAVQLYSPQNFPDRITSELTIPRDRWFCLRMELSVGDEGAVRVYVDDMLALEDDPHDTLPDAGVRLLRAGIDWSSGQSSPFEVYFDDLVLSQALVPCSAP